LRRPSLHFFRRVCGRDRNIAAYCIKGLRLLLFKTSARRDLTTWPVLRERTKPAAVSSGPVFQWTDRAARRTITLTSCKQDLNNEDLEQKATKEMNKTEYAC
jgi:hypothetical protein